MWGYTRICRVDCIGVFFVFWGLDAGIEYFEHQIRVLQKQSPIQSIYEVGNRPSKSTYQEHLNVDECLSVNTVLYTIFLYLPIYTFFCIFQLRSENQC